MNYPIVILGLLVFSCISNPTTENKNTEKQIAVIAYYSGNATMIDSFPVEKLTHIIYSFGHLRQTRFSIDNRKDTATIQKLVSLKSRNPALKVILSLGGWGGCEFCSPVFAAAAGRQQFAQSVKEQLVYFKADGIDLDWEYPAIEGYPGHAFKKEDKANFTALIKTLRDTLGNGYEISFAAGGFDKFLYESVEWDKVMPLLDKVNLMSYDLVGGYSKVTGHHTPLYSTQQQKQSADNAIRYLDSAGVPLHKVIIGAAFYARVWEDVPNVNHGLYQPGKFKSFIGYKQFEKYFLTDSGFAFYRDTVAQAPYAYNASRKLFATFDDSLSIANKTKYVLEKGLGGIMFWELSLDRTANGLVDVIDRVRTQKN
ncbi:MAG TPA: glycoside hydrolase family 18 protein [Chitinophagaceae bacterium]